MPYSELVESELERLQIQTSPQQQMSLAIYCEELARWNQKLNLTSLSGPGLVRRLVVEPIWIARQLSLEGSLLDIGAGNGSPAIPFHIVCGLRQCHLVEGRSKRAAFLRHVITRLHLANVVVHRARFEEVASTFASPDWISLQAVALTERLLKSVRMIVHDKTKVLWITSGEVQTRLSPVHTLSVPATGTRALVFQLDLS